MQEAGDESPFFCTLLLVKTLTDRNLNGRKMMDAAALRPIVEKSLEGTDLFVVEIKVSPANEIEVVVDSDTSLGIDTLAELSRRIEQSLDRDAEDFQLTVTSAGIGRPIKLLRQYRKLIGQSVEVVLTSGIKLLAVLCEASEDALVLEYPEKVSVEGKKRKETVTVRREVPMSEIKTACEYLTFK